jgi:hypothetical protein
MRAAFSLSTAFVATATLLLSACATDNAPSPTDGYTPTKQDPKAAAADNWRSAPD